MKILDVLTAPWAIQPDRLLEIQAIYATHLRGEKIDIEAVERRIGRPLKNEPQGYEVVDGVAILAVDGVISKRMNLFSQISGGASTELLARDFKAALADPNVTAIVLAIDSPGGSVDGVQQLAQLVRDSRGTKPIAAYADGLMASAAYWVGCAADPGRMFIASDTTIVGSIGVVATHTDVSKREEQLGVKTTEIVAGKFKRVASQFGALTESGRAELQSQVDAIYNVFVGEVATARGVTPEKVHDDMADGRLFIGKAAIQAGLVDGVTTLDALIAQLSADAKAGAAKAKPTKPTQKGTSMEINKETLVANHADLVAAFRAEGAQAERERIAAVEAQMMPGHRALIDKLKADGKTTGPEAAAAVIAAERDKLAKAGADLSADVPKPVNQPEPPAPKVETEADKGKQTEQEKLHERAKKYMAEHKGVTLLQALNAVATIKE